MRYRKIKCKSCEKRLKKSFKKVEKMKVETLKERMEGRNPCLDGLLIPEYYARMADIIIEYFDEIAELQFSRIKKGNEDEHKK